LKNKIEHLRDHLFATLEGLRDKDKPMEVDRALAISTVANSIIESAKVEMKFIDLVGGKGSGFIDGDPALPTPTAAPPTAPRLVNGKVQ
jgi:hypothetical protein